MFINYFKIAIRYFRRDKVYSIINIFGLSVGMAAVILIALVFQFLFSFDTYHKQYERIYRIQQELQDEHRTEWTQTVYPLAQELRNTIPEVEESAVMREIGGECLKSKDDIVLKDANGFLADPAILKILSFKFMEGNPETALNGPGFIVLSQTLAQKFFRGEQPLGKLLKGSFTKDLIVTGVFEDFPLNSHIYPSYLVSFSTMDRVLGRDYKGYKNDWTNNTYRNYVLLKRNADAILVDAKIKDLLDDKVERNDKKLYLKPIKDARINATREGLSNSPFYYYAAIALFILVLACINFINLTTARSGLREKEIGIRKVVGGSRFSLIRQFIGESILISFPAMMIAFVFAKALLPLFNSFMYCQLEISIVHNWRFIFAMIITFLFVGVLAGIYPAFYLSSLKPITAIKGTAINTKSGKPGKGTLRKLLVSFQFIVSITLILSTVFMFRQVEFMKNKDLGYNKANLLYCAIETNDSKSNFRELRNSLLANKDIIDASVSTNAPAHENWSREINWEGGNEDQKLNVLFNSVDYNFISTFQMKIVKGRSFLKEFATDSSACVINETLASEIGWANPIGKKLLDKKYTVIGVVKDFHPFSVHNRIPPYLMVLHNGELRRDNNYCVRVSSNNDISRLMEYVGNTLRTFIPDAIFELQLYDADFDKEMMMIWEGVQSTFGFFSVFMIVIALIGLLGLVSFSSRRKTKEIGIRKVLGASEIGLYFLVVKEFLIMLGISIVLAAPAAYVILVTTPGAYKYQVTPVDFIAPLITIILVTVVVTLRQVLSVTKANLTESLHYE